MEEERVAGVACKKEAVNFYVSIRALEIQLAPLATSEPSALANKENGVYVRHLTLVPSN
jgi:hypothetical protein